MGPFEGLPRLCMATMSPSHNGANAKRVLDAITSAETGYLTWFAVFPRSRSSPYHDWVELLKKEFTKEQQSLYASRYGWSAPLIWIEHPDGTRHAIGGRDNFCEWASTEFAHVPSIVKAASEPLRWIDALASISKPAS